MRSNTRLSVLALVVVAGGLSLTACGPEGSSASAATSSAGASATTSSLSAAGQDGSSGSGSSSGSSSKNTSGGSGSSNSGSGSASGTTCKTSNLKFSAHHGISGEGQEIVELTNGGSSTCTMHGFPGVDLSNGSDTTISAGRSKSDTPSVSLAPGERTEFVLNYPFNNSGGSGFTFTTMIVTPPNETHSTTLSTSINIPVDNPDQPTKGPGIVVNAVGAGK